MVEENGEEEDETESGREEEKRKDNKGKEEEDNQIIPDYFEFWNLQEELYFLMHVMEM